MPSGVLFGWGSELLLSAAVCLYYYIHSMCSLIQKKDTCFCHQKGLVQLFFLVYDKIFSILVESGQKAPK